MGLLPLALSVGVVAVLWTFVSPMIAVVTWPAFIGWAFYFVGGGDAKAIPKVALPLASGVLLAWIAYTLIGPPLGDLGLPVAVGLVAFVMVMMGNHGLFAVIPAQFTGAAIFFGTGAALVDSLISIAAGLVLGVLSTLVPGLLAKTEDEPKPAEAEAAL